MRRSAVRLTISEPGLDGARSDRLELELAEGRQDVNPQSQLNIQFGYDDSARRGPAFYAGWRTRWVAEGLPWWSSRPAPEGWNPSAQVAKVTDRAADDGRAPGEQCCRAMFDQVTMDCAEHESPYECADQLVIFVPKYREYGLIVHDRGESFVLIEFCPWCGSQLPPSQRDRWFATLEDLGIDPDVDQLPAPFRDGTWLLES